MSNAIHSGMHNIANHLTPHSSPQEGVSILKKKQLFDDMESLVKHIKREHNDFDLDNWVYCHQLDGKTEREIYISLSEHYAKNSIDYQQCLSSEKKLSLEIQNALSTSGYPTDSLSDFFQEVKQSIVAGKNDYLDILKVIFSNYMDYVRELRTTITSLSQYTKAGKKDGHIAVNYSDFKKELEKIKIKHQEKLGNDAFFHIQILFECKNDHGFFRHVDNQKIHYKNKNQVDKAVHTIERLLKDIKGIKIKKEECLSEKNKDINFKFFGSVDFDDINKFINNIDTTISIEGILSESEIEKKRKKLISENTSLFGVVKPGFDIGKEMIKIREDNENRKKDSKYKNILQTEFDLFKKSLDVLEKKINSNLDELSKKFSTANSNYDNFVKIVSSTMNTLLEMAKGFLRQ
ncbi:IpaD/SipD/SspD family type III secretion system needle tip protein [Proteus vulgaris]|uniref:IpaD/SipD/SspD family type III secretion system needle tip protein n=2 Tax=Morganellaceae TaxID=1903414 RepID=UPI001E5A59C7|nr:MULTISPECIES: IpaD/SipD/SspD family type III secretion system needle tip protein [Proteus]MDM3564602.1 IpaD/SipD/SspD family type III secretion system needle tip protein [Proteus vulgaris]